jgi:hypothetical protein
MFPVLAGAMVGLATYTVRIWLRVVFIGALGIGLGTTAAWLSGELAISSVYLFIDTAQVIAAAVMAGVLVRAWIRRGASSVAR